MLLKYYAQEIGWLHGRQKSVGSLGYGTVGNMTIHKSHLAQSKL
jgi:hypothetical protein